MTFQDALKNLFEANLSQYPEIGKILTTPEKITNETSILLILVSEKTYIPAGQAIYQPVTQTAYITIIRPKKDASDATTVIETGQKIRKMIIQNPTVGGFLVSSVLQTAEQGEDMFLQTPSVFVNFTLTGSYFERIT